MHEQTHPDTEMLDRLRAGMLDDDISEKSAIEVHLSNCPVCRKRLNAWQQLDTAALSPQLDGAAVSARLKRARQEALSTPSRRGFHHYPALATAAMLLVAVTIGFWALQPQFSGTPQMTAQTGTDVPDIYEDLDFYLWLSDENGHAPGEENSNTNANST